MLGTYIKWRIDRILWEVWDPIGVHDIPQARDEYHSYIDGIYEMLIQCATERELAAHLYTIASETMGMPNVTIEAMLPAVKALKSIAFVRKS
jgi:hypothetical protein